MKKLFTVLILSGLSFQTALVKAAHADDQVVRGTVSCEGKYTVNDAVHNSSTEPNLKATQDVLCYGSGTCGTTTILLFPTIAGHMTSLSSQLDFFADNKARFTAAIVDLSPEASPSTGPQVLNFASGSKTASVGYATKAVFPGGDRVNVKFDCIYTAADSNASR